MQPKSNLEEQYDKIYRYCYFKLGNAQLAEDVTQETFLKSLESERFLAGGCPLAFLYTVARNLCIDEYRKKKPWQMEEEELSSVADQTAFWQQEEQLLDAMVLRQALGELSEQERELVLLRYVGEMPVSQLAAWMGMSRFTLYRKTKQILKKLERRIADETKQKKDAARGVETDL